VSTSALKTIQHLVHGAEGIWCYTRGDAVTIRRPEEAQDAAHGRRHMHVPTAV
jgi:hypothetical protein